MGKGGYDFYISACKMEYKKNKKKFSLAFEKEVALNVVSNKRKLEESKPADVYFKPLTILAKKPCLNCLIGSSYASDLGISSTCIFIDYSAHLLEFVLFV